MRQETGLRQRKYLHPVIEQDHRFLKKDWKPMLGFKSFRTAEKTIVGIKSMHRIRKGQLEYHHASVLSAVASIQCLIEYPSKTQIGR